MKTDMEMNGTATQILLLNNDIDGQYSTQGNALFYGQTTSSKPLIVDKNDESLTNVVPAKTYATADATGAPSCVK